VTHRGPCPPLPSSDSVVPAFRTCKISSAVPLPKAAEISRNHGQTREVHTFTANPKTSRPAAAPGWLALCCDQRDKPTKAGGPPARPCSAGCQPTPPSAPRKLGPSGVAEAFSHLKTTMEKKVLRGFGAVAKVPVRGGRPQDRGTYL